jgi:RHS repeat-associated protein
VVTLNDEGQPIQITNPAGQSTYLSYLYGDLVAISNPLGQATGAYYNSLNQLAQITDAAGNTTSYAYTPLGQVASQTNPLGAVTSYAYDPDGNLTSVTDASGHTTSYAYNGDSEVTKKTDPLGQATAYAYDPDGNLASVVDAIGNEDTFAYDDFGNVTTAKYGVSGSSAQTTIASTYDAGNRMTKAVQTPGGTYQLSYDGLNDILSQTSPAGTVTRTYDSFGLPTSLTAPGQTKITYTYDKDERLTKIAQGSTSVSQAYDSLSRLSSVTLPDGITGTNTYDAANDVTAQTFMKGSTSVGAVDYTYTADNQISSESGSLAGASLPAAVSGNTYNADNELTDAGYTYNSDGDLTANGTSTYTWNAQNQLTGISGTSTAAFTYNPFGQQATSTTGGTTTSYLYNGVSPSSSVIQELAGTTPTENLLTGAQGQIFQLTTPGGANSSLLASPLGSTLALASSAGAITTSYTYSPAGAVTASGASSPNTFEFDGTQNQGTGLYLMGARYYNPATGTFASQDPTGFAGGTTNLYEYVNDDPIDLNDPTGCLDCSGDHPSTWGAVVAVGILLAVVAVVAVAPWFAVFGLEALEVAWSVASAALATGDVVVGSYVAGAAGALIGSCFGIP